VAGAASATALVPACGAGPRDHARAGSALGRSPSAAANVAGCASARNWPGCSGTAAHDPACAHLGRHRPPGWSRGAAVGVPRGRTPPAWVAISALRRAPRRRRQSGEHGLWRGSLRSRLPRRAPPAGRWC